MFTFLESLRFVQGVAPVADAFAGTVYPVGLDISAYGKAAFVIMMGVGATGTVKVQVVAGDTASPLNETAVPFQYRRIASGTTPGAVTQASVAADGFTTTAGGGEMYVVEVDGKAIAATGHKYVHLKLTEVVDDGIVGAVLALAGQPRYADSTADISD